MEAAEAVLKFLSSVGPGDQVEFYLRLFRARPGASFAAIAVDERAMEASGDSVAVDLRFLHALSLRPCVVLGLHQPENAGAHLQALQERLRQAGVTVAAGDTASGPDPVRAAIERGELPVLLASGADAEARLSAVADLLAGLETRKLIFLRMSGGLRREDGERLDVMNLGRHAEHARWTPRDDDERRVVEQARTLLSGRVPHHFHVAMTSPLNLLHELFTVKGAGTLLRRASRVVRHDSYQDVDVARLGELLESSFGRAPLSAFFERPADRLYLEEAYRGVAIVLDTPQGAYVTKFAVTREAQGEGIGHDLWHALQSENPRLYWRARRDNPVRAWYERICDCRIDVGEWTVFGWQLSPAAIPEAVAKALAQPIDLEPAAD